MFHLDNNSGISAMPAPASTQSPAVRWFTEGDGTKAISWPGQDWFNIVQAELLNTLTAAGIAPDKAKFNQLSLAIKSIINTNALLKENLLSEIKDEGTKAQATSRDNLGLKSAATHDVTESNLDTTSGRLVQVGDYGIGGETIGLPGGENVHSWFVDKPTGKYKGGSNITGTAYPGKPYYEFDWMSHAKGLYGFLVEYTADGFAAIHTFANGGWTGIYYVLTSAGGNFNNTFRFGQVGTIGQEKNASTLFSQQTGSGGIVSGAMFNWYNNNIIMGIVRNASDGTNGFAITLNGNQILSIDTGGTVRNSGNILAGAGVFESSGNVRVYSPNNPQPIDLSAYATQAWVLGNFVQDVRLLGRTWISWDGSIDAPPGCVFVSGGDFGSNDGSYAYAALQKLYNGNWYTVSHA